MDKIKKYNKHYFDISIPKSYARIFKINKGDLFVWDIVRTEPLTFSLIPADDVINNLTLLTGWELSYPIVYIHLIRTITIITVFLTS